MASDPSEELRAVGRMLWEAGLVSYNGGNMSVRAADGSLIVTRTGSALGRLETADLVEVAADGSCRGQPSMDTPVHRAVYDATDAGAVVHAHPRHAIALSLVSRALQPVDAEGRLKLGSVPVVETDGLPDALRESPIAMVRGHGSYSRGEDLREALQWTSVLEESAQVLWLLRAMGTEPESA